MRIQELTNSSNVMRNSLLVLILIIFCGLFTSCYNRRHYIWDTREYLSVERYTNIRQAPSEKSRKIDFVGSSTGRYDTLIRYNNEWYEIRLISGVSGYVPSKSVSLETEEYCVREKNYRDYLEDWEQTFALNIIDFCVGNDRTKSKPSFGLILITMILVLITVLIANNDNWWDVAKKRRWLIYAMVMLSNLLLIYIFFFTTFFTDKVERPEGKHLIDGIFLINVLYTLLYLAFKFCGAIALWITFVNTFKGFLDTGTDLVSHTKRKKFIAILIDMFKNPNPLYHAIGNAIALSFALICVYWIRKFSNFAIILIILWNLIFFVIYIVYIIKRGGGFLRCLIAIVLYFVCLIPAFAYTIVTIKFYFIIVCGALVFEMFMSGGGSFIGGLLDNSSSSSSSSDNSNTETETYTEIFVPGEISSRKIKHYNNWEGVDDLGNHWTRNSDNSWEKD